MLHDLGPRVNDFIQGLLTLERRIDPLFRNTFDRIFQRPLAGIAQFFLRLLHRNPETRLCHEIIHADEEKLTGEITDSMSRFTERQYKGTIAERAGNTKTYGLVQAEFHVNDGLPRELRKGVFAEPRRFPAWIRFGGSGPYWPPDVSDGGILSIGIKLMGVPGEKLMPDEKHTQDFVGISSPTFTTPNVRENLKLQRAIYARTPVFYFLNPFDSHYLDAVMQGLYARMNTSPLEVRYWSCTPYLLGASQAMKYSVLPLPSTKTTVPVNPPDDWLRQAMSATLATRDWEFDFAVQIQTDPRRMPIEDASIEWPENRSPFIPVARISVPRQIFDTPERILLAREFSFNPWHSIADHRPLGNQNRARLKIYFELSRLRQAMNHEPHLEPASHRDGRSAGS
jgi:hypothetical protein